MQHINNIPKITAVCLTFARPQQLGRNIECFLRQTYPNKELVVYDDGGQYPDQPHGDGWRVVSVPERAANLGTKRNLAVRHVSSDTDMIQTWDDDDIYLPWTLAACVAVLKHAVWAQPRQALEWDGTQFRRFETFNRNYPDQIAYHGNWAYRLKEFWAVGGYPAIMDDDSISVRMNAAYGPSKDTITEEFPLPGYVYSWLPSDRHLSQRYAADGMDAAWQNLDVGPLPPATLTIGWDRDYSAIPIPATAEPRKW